MNGCNRTAGSYPNYTARNHIIRRTEASKESKKLGKREHTTPL